MSTTNVNSGSELGVTLGGWTPFTCNITKEASEVFEEIFKDFVGVSYSPVAFATQFVSGINYRFLCNAQPVYPDAVNHAAIVDIYKPIHGSAHITEIKMIKDVAYGK
ncbi:MAG: hypothetical protein KAF91_23865 [Nostoc sp. TH1S01]|nr:hypothetical protein [Nostoc sp. TH1S01]